MKRPQSGNRDRGASTVEYGLLVAGVTATFMVGAFALQGAVGAVFDLAVTSVEQSDAPGP